MKGGIRWKMHKIDRFVKAATVVPLALAIGRYPYDFFIRSRKPPYLHMQFLEEVACSERRLLGLEGYSSSGLPSLFSVPKTGNQRYLTSQDQK